MEVGPLEDQAVWVVYRTTGGPLGPTTEPYQSHQLQLAVECSRCHFPGNLWNIAEIVAWLPDGQTSGDPDALLAGDDNTR